MAKELRIDHFAELLSQGLSMDAICGRMGLTNRAANAYLSKICRGLGPQARG